PAHSTRAAPISPAAPVAVMVPVVPAMPPVMTPVHLGRTRNLLCAFLHRSSGAGIAQRKRQRALRRNSQSEQCADGGKPQNFRHVHLRSPSRSLGSTDLTPATCRLLQAGLLVATQIEFE